MFRLENKLQNKSAPDETQGHLIKNH